MDGMDELKQTFFTECAELLCDMEERLLKLDEGTQDKEQLNAIFRCAHSIKGGSGAFGFDAVMHFTHALEALLDSLRDGKLQATREVIDTLLKSKDIVTQLLDAAREGIPPSASLGASTLEALQRLVQGQKAVAPIMASVSKPIEIDRNYTIIFTPHEHLFASGNEPLNIFREIRKFGVAEIAVDTSRVPGLKEIDPTNCMLGWTISLRTSASEAAISDIFEFVRDISDIKITGEDIPAFANETADALVPKKIADDHVTKSAGATSIRVDIEKVDRLVNMVGELVITEAMLRAQIRHLPMDQLAGLQHGVDELSHHTRELQEAVMAVRMQPVKSIFSRMPRIVHDTSALLGKDIQLIMSGENTEVDKTVIEQLGDPLTHMIRNSCDHGIETPDQRAWNDKSLQGTIHLSAYHRSGRIIIEIQDDGAGINRERVLAKAKEKGLVAENAILSDEEIDNLIFLPGFSTAEKVTNVSGRGVGMDVVRRNIEGLGGMVRIINNPGKGSTFTVSLPLTLAILDGMIVRVGSENYIVPITSIIETIRPKQNEVHHVQGKGDVINMRGDFVPLIYLHRLFGIENAQKNIDSTLIVLAESSKGSVGLIVDELIGQQQVVIKSLEANADPVKGISGATILGDGKVSLILEINELCQLRQSQMPQLTLINAA